MDNQRIERLHRSGDPDRGSRRDARAVLTGRICRAGAVAREHFEMIRLGQVRTEQQEAGEVELAASDRAE
ncbi:hypothetical protein D3C83_97880 [compost metagenome]